MSKAFELVVPQMNPNDEQAVLVRWQVASATQVVAGQPVATLETTKAAFDVETPRDGYVFYNLAPKTVIPVGARLAWICDENVPPPADDAARDEPEPSVGGERANHAKSIATHAPAWIEPGRPGLLRRAHRGCRR